MPKCTIDGRAAEFSPGENLIEVARRVGVEVPYFCYHPGLSVVAQCRMCTVEIEKMPKLQTACSTAATDGMVVMTRSEKSKINQRAVMEFLLINHPLDCPICDKSGECDLQDNSYKFGDALMRTTEERRTYVDLDMGPVIQKNMNRCIHCTRCIRFGDEIAGIREMVAVRRSNNTEITTVDGRALETDYAGNYADVCPTGSLTLKDFRFKKRVWMLKKTDTVCEGCSTGCNMELHQDADVIYRAVPRPNMDINKYWLCDEGRFNWHYVMSDTRVTEPSIRNTPIGWTGAAGSLREAIQEKNAVFLVGSDLTQEELKQLQEFAGQVSAQGIYHFGTAGIETTAQDVKIDDILRHASQTSNLNGAEKLGLQPFKGLNGQTQTVVIFRGGRAELPTLPGGIKAYGVGVFEADEAEKFELILPSLSFAEKDGTIVNFQNKEQKIKRAIRPVGKSKALSEILMLVLHSKASHKSGAA